MSESYRDLRVWQRSMDLVCTVYSETRDFPKEELYG
jgi:23S rRNA-intervening sequence protein